MPARILIIDDEETIRNLFKAYLTEDGFTIEAASSVEEAIIQLKEQKFDLLLIDLIMPEMDGLEVLRRLRREGIDVPAAILTAYEFESDPEQDRSLKISGFVPKGISMGEISQKIQEIIKGRKAVDHKKTRILVVDDEQSVLDFLKEVIESQGYEFFSSQSGEEALKVIKEIRPNLVLLDIIMPEKDGIEVLRLIRQEDKNLPVVILTSFSTGERFKEARALNVSGFIPKGASVTETKHKIQAILNLSQK